MKNPYSVILLDLDGTLINSTELFYEADRNILQKKGIQLTQDDIDRMHYEDGFSVIKNILTKYGYLSEQAEQVLKDIVSHSYELLQEKVSWYPDVKLFADESTLRGIRLGIVTRANPDDFENIKNRLSVDEYMPVLVHGWETKERHKPDPYPLMLAVERLNVPIDSCLYVGDHKEDLYCAQRAGMDCCLLLRDHVPLSLKEFATHTARSLKDIHTLTPLYA